MTAAVEVRRRERLHGLDALRGLGVLLMVLDHWLVAFPAGPAGAGLRWTVTRLALPIFCVVAGALGSRRANWRRLGLVAAAGLLLTAGAPAARAQPDVLVLLAGALAAAPWVWRGGYERVGLVLAVCALQPTTWPVPGDGYEPGLVLGLVLLGPVVGLLRLTAVGAGLPGWIRWAGRYPLSVYVVHVPALWLASSWL